VDLGTYDVGIRRHVGLVKTAAAIPDRNGIAIKKNQTPNKIGRMDITAGVTIITIRQ
jgi:hypothetical protein